MSGSRRPTRHGAFSTWLPAVGAVTAVAVVAATGLVFVAGLVAEPSVGRADVPTPAGGELPAVEILASHGVATELDSGAAEQIIVATLAWLGVPAGEVDRAELTLEPGAGQGPPIAVATLFGSQPLRFERTLELSRRTACSPSCASGTRQPLRRPPPRCRPV